MNSKNFLLIIIGICIALFLKLFIIDMVKVSGPSMSPTLEDKTTVYISKLAYGIPIPFGNQLAVQWAKPENGDVVIFLHNNKMVVKRCCGVAGQVLEYSTNTGYSLHIDGKTYPLTEAQYQRIKYDSVVPENTILAIGDNASESVDSRDYGFIPVHCVLGKVLCK